MWKFIRSRSPKWIKSAVKHTLVAAKRCRAALQPRFRFVELQPNLKIRAYRDSVLCQAIAAGAFECAEQDFVRRFLREGDIFVDIGANIGLFTLIGARAVRDSGRVVSLEPCEKTFERLLENVADNQITNVDCHRLAVSDETGCSTFHVSLDGYDAWNSFAKPTLGKRFATKNVTTIRWDDFAKNRDLVGRVQLMKVDIEGWEYQFLAGAKSTLTREDAPVLLVEFTEQNAKAAGNRCRDVYSRLEEFGYGMYRYHADPPKMKRAENLDHFEYVNLYAIKDNKLEIVIDRIGGAIVGCDRSNSAPAVATS